MAQMMQEGLDQLRSAIETCPIIDNHAHNLLRPEREEHFPLISIVSEARGEALKDATRSLAHLRAVKQLRELYAADANATWDDLLKNRAEIDRNELITKCLAGIHTILIDDGLDDGTNVQPVRWHDHFTPGKNRRIVRIETLAANIMQVMWQEGRAPLKDLEGTIDLTTVWPVFLQAFENAVVDEIKDENVAGFKSVVCYRSGLDVTLGDELAVAAAGQDAFKRYLRSCSKGNFRIQHKGLNDCLVVSTCRLITANYKQSGVSKPLQFHTGLGDNDISILLSNPAFLQGLIGEFPRVNFVLLHSSYPFTREAGYLATVYANAFLDLGEIFPMVSIEGQVAAIKQAMELTPFSKLLWSTDGHYFPESYWLANKQFKHVLFRVFKDLLVEGVLSPDDAIRAARDILFENANWLYNLKLNREEAASAGASRALPLLPVLPQASRDTAHDAVFLPHAPAKRKIYDSRSLNSYLRTSYGKATTYFVVQWIDWLGTTRNRAMPYNTFRRFISNDSHIGITRATLFILQDDSLTPPASTSGRLLLEPDLSTIRPIHWKDLRGATTVLSTFRTSSGSPSKECPRAILQSLAGRLAHEHGLYILVGFELEITFLRAPSPSSTTDSGPQSFTAIEADTAHAWSTLTAQQGTSIWSIIAKIVEELEQLGFPIEQFHSESGPGQYEFTLSPLPLVTAVDVLYQVRQAIQLKAQRHGLRATLHPCPLGTFGSGLHAHISLNRIAKDSSAAKSKPPVNTPTSQPPEVTDGTTADAATTTTDSSAFKPEPAFWSGVLSQLRAICAFSLPNDDSYRRVADDRWGCGSWVAWGTENKEVPLRRIANSSASVPHPSPEVPTDSEVRDGEGGADTAANEDLVDGLPSVKVGQPASDTEERWEVRSLDGMGNAYFALAAIVGAGLWGLDERMALPGKDCDLNPAHMTDEQGAEYGVTEKLPQSLTESLAALEASEVLGRVFGEAVVGNYIAVKKAEQEKLLAMPEEERRVWLLQRY